MSALFVSDEKVDTATKTVYEVGFQVTFEWIIQQKRFFTINI